MYLKNKTDQGEKKQTNQGKKNFTKKVVGQAGMYPVFFTASQCTSRQ